MVIILYHNLFQSITVLLQKINAQLKLNELIHDQRFKALYNKGLLFYKKNIFLFTFYSSNNTIVLTILFAESYDYRGMGFLGTK